MDRRLAAVLAAIGAVVIIAVGVSLDSDDDGGGGGGDDRAASETDPPSELTPPSETPTEQASSTPDQTEEPPKQRPMTFVGRVRGGSATIAVVVDGSKATAYFCDGVAVESWLDGRAFGGRIELSGDNGKLTGSFDGRRASGRLRVEGSRFGFRLRQVDPPRGLYRFADTIDGAEVKGGWIVLPSGRQVGLVSVDGSTQPAPRLDTETGEVRVDGRELTVEQLS